MRSDTILVSGDGRGLKEALAETEAVANYKGLSKKETLHLTLLAEEMLGMLQGLTGETNAKFFIEDDDKNFRLHLITETAMDSEKRRRLLESSTSGRNEAAKGVMGKLRDLFAQAFEPMTDDAPAYCAMGWMGYDGEYAGFDMAMYDSAWSLSRYRESAEGDAEAWDELEKSIVANIADEIRIGIRKNTVEMIIYKKI